MLLRVVLYRKGEGAEIFHAIDMVEAKARYFSLMSGISDRSWPFISKGDITRCEIQEDEGNQTWHIVHARRTRSIEHQEGDFCNV